METKRGEEATEMLSGVVQNWKRFIEEGRKARRQFPPRTLPYVDARS